jgi:hypothetical protein
VTIGSWLRVYQNLDTGNPRTVLNDVTRQCAFGGLCLLVFEYALRMDLSRFFLVLYTTLAWAFLLLFRLIARRMVPTIRREFARPHYVMVVGTGERAIRMAVAL